MLKIQQTEKIMEQYFEILERCPLFEGIGKEELLSVLKCLEVRTEKYKSGEPVFLQGDAVRKLGVVLEGSIQIVRDDYYGNRSIVTTVSPPQIFAETFAFAGVSSVPLSAWANSDSAVMMINPEKIICSCSKACGFHSRIISNLVRVMASKNLEINKKLEITSQRTTRDKLMTYLFLTSREKGAKSFTVPFDRQELADYLEVDRSGLSAEIGKLKREGVLLCRRSEFTLL